MPHLTGRPPPSPRGPKNNVAIRLLLDGGADPNSTDEDKDTPLHYACSSGNEEIIRLLLSKGADPTASDGLGRTPSERNTTAEVQKQLQEESYKCKLGGGGEEDKTLFWLQHDCATHDHLLVLRMVWARGRGVTAGQDEPNALALFAAV